VGLCRYGARPPVFTAFQDRCKDGGPCRPGAGGARHGAANRGFTYVFVGGRLDQPRSDLKRAWELVTQAADLEDVRIHDLRHTFASYGAAAGMGLIIIGRLLGHADVKTTNRYSHFDDDPLRRAANAVGIALTTAMANESSNDEARVVTLHR
jgi:integrase